MIEIVVVMIVGVAGSHEISPDQHPPLSFSTTGRRSISDDDDDDDNDDNNIEEEEDDHSSDCQY